MRHTQGTLNSPQRPLLGGGSTAPQGAKVRRAKCALLRSSSFLLRKQGTTNHAHGWRAHKHRHANRRRSSIGAETQTGNVTLGLGLKQGTTNHAHGWRAHKCRHANRRRSSIGAETKTGYVTREEETAPGLGMYTEQVVRLGTHRFFQIRRAIIARLEQA